MLGRNLPRSSGTYEALTASVPFLLSIRLRSPKQNFTQVIRGRGTEFLKNAPAAWYAKTSQQLCPVVRIGTVWQALSSGDALPMGAFATRGQSMVQAGGRNFLPQRRAFTAHFWVVRISRLIGNSDTTASCTVWQVTSSRESNAVRIGITGAGSDPAGNNSPRHTKRHSSRSGALLSRAGHWPPSKLRAVVVSTAPTAGCPGRSPLFRAARGRMLLPGVCCSSGAGRDTFQQPVHHWRH